MTILKNIKKASLIGSLFLSTTNTQASMKAEVFDLHGTGYNVVQFINNNNPKIGAEPAPLEVVEVKGKHVSYDPKFGFEDVNEQYQHLNAIRRAADLEASVLNKQLSPDQQIKNLLLEKYQAIFLISKQQNLDSRKINIFEGIELTELDLWDFHVYQWCIKQGKEEAIHLKDYIDARTTFAKVMFLNKLTKELTRPELILIGKEEMAEEIQSALKLSHSHFEVMGRFIVKVGRIVVKSGSLKGLKPEVAEAYLRVANYLNSNVKAHISLVEPKTAEHHYSEAVINKKEANKKLAAAKKALKDAQNKPQRNNKNIEGDSPAQIEIEAAKAAVAQAEEGVKNAAAKFNQAQDKKNNYEDAVKKKKGQTQYRLTSTVIGMIQKILGMYGVQGYEDVAVPCKYEENPKLRTILDNIRKDKKDPSPAIFFNALCDDLKIDKKGSGFEHPTLFKAFSDSIQATLRLAIIKQDASPNQDEIYIHQLLEMQDKALNKNERIELRRSLDLTGI